MKGTRKFEFTLELNDVVEENDVENIYEISSYILEESLNCVLSHDIKLLLNLQEEMSRYRNYLISYNKGRINTNNIRFALGRYEGIIDSIYIFLKIIIDKEHSIESIAKAEAKDIPHINDVISVVFNQQGIRHGVLAQKIGVEKNTLTSIMDKLVKAGLITFSRPGKYKYYYLTQEGKDFYKNNNLKSISNIDYLIEQLLIYIYTAKEPSNVLIKIMNALFKGNHSFDGYAIDEDKRIDPVSLIPEIVADNGPIDISFTNADFYIQVDSAEVISFSKIISAKKIIMFNNTNQVNHIVLKNN